jgi:hypothetical protein
MPLNGLGRRVNYGLKRCHRGPVFCSNGGFGLPGSGAHGPNSAAG